jgi:hypothetical protein
MLKLKSIPFRLLLGALWITMAWSDQAFAGSTDPWVDGDASIYDLPWNPESPREPPLDPPPGDHTVQEDSVPTPDPLSGGGRPPRDGDGGEFAWRPDGPSDPFEMLGDRNLVEFVLEMSTEPSPLGTQTGPSLSPTMFGDEFGASNAVFTPAPGGAIPAPGGLVLIGLGSAVVGWSRRRR